MKSKNTKSLNEKLKAALSNLHVDLFDYEKRVTANFLNHMSVNSEQLKIPRACLYLRIRKKGDKIQAFLYHQNKLQQAISMDDLAFYFVDRSTAILIDSQKKIALPIATYIQKLSKANRLGEEDVCIWINAQGDTVLVKAFNGDAFIKDITLVSLIKHFK